METVFKAISDYGALIIVAGIFLYFIIRVLNIFVDRLQNQYGVEKHDEDLEIRRTIGARVDEIIHDFLDETHHGERVQVIEFSNTVTSVAFLPFKYMSCTYEVYKFGRPPLGHRIDRISTSLFTQFFSELEDKPVAMFDMNRKEPAMGGAMYDILKGDSCSKALCAKMMTMKGKFIGYVSLIQDEEFDDFDIQEIQEVANKVCALLATLDK